MLQRDAIKELPSKVGQAVVVWGWIYHRRTAGKLCFVEVRDGTGVVQAVVHKGSVSAEHFEAADKARIESCVRVSGAVRADPRSPSGVELSVTAFEVTGPCVADFPMQKKEHGIGFLMEERHLYLRSRRPTAVLRIR